MAKPIQLLYKNLGASLNASRCSYEVREVSSGKVILERCRDPLTDGARAVMAEQPHWPPGQEIELVDDHGRVLVRASLKWATERVVAESSTTGAKFARYVPFDPKARGSE